MRRQKHSKLKAQLKVVMEPSAEISCGRRNVSMEERRTDADTNEEATKMMSEHLVGEAGNHPNDTFEKLMKSRQTEGIVRTE